MSGRRVLCDFCDSPEVVCAYAVDESREKGDPHHGWASCEACARLIDADDGERLLHRIAKRSRAAGEQGSMAVLKGRYRAHVELFWRTKTGERVAVNPMEPFDPTRTDEFGEMLRHSGRSLDIEVHRDDGDAERTFSQEALENLGLSAVRWAGSRVKRQWDRTGVAPQRLRMRVTVELDNELDYPKGATGAPQEFTIYYDGERRHTAGGAIDG